MVTSKVRLPEGGSYPADKNPDGTWNLRDVHCFVVDREAGYDEKWMDEALAKSRRRREQDQYVAPLHVRHHDVKNLSSAQEAAAVEAAGFFVPKDLVPFRHEGQVQRTLVADWLNVPEGVYKRIKAKRLPYRSVEISRSKGEWVSCALLDHEPPANKFPITTVGAEAYSAAAREETSAVVVYRASEEPMTTPNMSATGNSGAAPQGSQAPAPSATPVVVHPAPAPAIDYDALAAALVKSPAFSQGVTQAVQAGVVAANDGKTSPQAGDPAAKDDELPAEQGAEKEPALSAYKEVARELAKVKSSNLEMRREREVDTQVRGAIARLGKIGVKVDEADEAELRVYAAKGKDVLDVYVATREKHRAVDPPTWSGQERKSATPASRPELETYKAKGADVLARAQALAEEYDQLSADLGDGFRSRMPLSEFLKASVEPSNHVAINGGRN